MTYLDYWAIIRRRWIVIAVVILVDVFASAALYHRADKSAGFQSCLTIYVADVSAPSTVAASSDLTASAELLAGESAANFFGDDLLDIARSRSVASYIVDRLSHAPSSSALGDANFDHINGSISGARQDRTVNLCVNNPVQATAGAAAAALGTALTRDREQFVGKKIANRTFVTIVSAPSTGPVPRSRKLLTLALQIVLGVFVAGALALLWDALDPRVRGRADVEAALGVPVLAERN